MTLVQQIITDAFRQSNLIAVGDSPSLESQDEALRYLNRIVRSVFGNEAGEQLEEFPVGKKNISRPQGYPWDEEYVVADWYVPINKRLMLNLEKATTIYLDPHPSDGSRMGVIDVAGNLSTYNLTLVGNGRIIETTPSLVLNTNSANYEWFYRQDKATWFRTTNLGISDTFPFPEEFDDMFITMLAIRVNPAYGRTIDEQSASVLDRSRSQFRARYANAIQTSSENGLLRMSKSPGTRYFVDDSTRSDDFFNSGIVW